MIANVIHVILPLKNAHYLRDDTSKMRPWSLFGSAS